jgi:hypothetical protein
MVALIRTCGVPAALLMWSVALAACSAEGDSSGGGGRNLGSDDPQAFDNATPANQGNNPGGQDFGNTGATAPTMRPVLNPNADQTTGVDFSYIWIANTMEGTVSKIDTRTLTELGRYLTSPNGLGLPSRTTVAADGDVAVANRGGASNALGGDGGGITKIYATQDKCVDKNGNGAIDTSTGASDVRPWGEDECIAWHTPLPSYFSNRPVAWALPPAPDAPADVWTAAASTCTAAACTIDVIKLNGLTGEEAMPRLTISGLSGVDFISTGITGGLLAGFPFLDLTVNYGPYGGAADAGGNFWVFVGNTTQLIRVDAVTNEYRVWPIEPAGNGYGITIDEQGRIFICGSLGLSRFTPSDETWMTSNAGPILGMNGCMTDGAGKIWVGGGSDFGDLGLHGFDADTLASVGSFPVGPVKGVSIDVDGYIWGVGSGGAFGANAGSANTAWRVDPATGETMQYDGLNGAYSYSDMTGFGLKTAGFQPPLE